VLSALAAKLNTAGPMNTAVLVTNVNACPTHDDIVFAVIVVVAAALMVLPRNEDIARAVGVIMLLALTTLPSIEDMAGAVMVDAMLPFTAAGVLLNVAAVNVAL